MTSPPDDVSRVEQLLWQRVSWAWTGIVLKLAIGVPLLFLGPAVLASIFWVVQWQFDHFYAGWLALFGVLSLIMIPLMVRMELRGGDGFLMSALPERPAGWSRAMLVGGPAGLSVATAHALANPRALTAGPVEVFLTGPRLVVQTVQQLRARRALAGVPIRRAAEVVCTLQRYDHGQPPRRLCAPGEREEDLGPVLAWLALHDCVGIRADRERVFLYSAFRAAVAAALRT